MANTPRLEEQLDIERCPFCAVHKPNLIRVWTTKTTAYNGRSPRMWHAYLCKTCGGIVTAWAEEGYSHPRAIYPEVKGVDDAIPERAREYLNQALASVHTPAGSVILAASAVDAMLKAKGYTSGSLNSRIDKAAEDHLITKEMAQWAHEVRLDANYQRHADLDSPLPTADDAARCCEFAAALGSFLFVLPARVKVGLEATKNR